MPHRNFRLSLQALERNLLPGGSFFQGMVCLLRGAVRYRRAQQHVLSPAAGSVLRCLEGRRPRRVLLCPEIQPLRLACHETEKSPEYRAAIYRTRSTPRRAPGSTPGATPAKVGCQRRAAERLFASHAAAVSLDGGVSRPALVEKGSLRR